MNLMIGELAALITEGQENGLEACCVMLSQKDFDECRRTLPVSGRTSTWFGDYILGYRVIIHQVDLPPCIGFKRKGNDG